MTALLKAAEMHTVHIAVVNENVRKRSQATHPDTDTSTSATSSNSNSQSTVIDAQHVFDVDGQDLPPAVKRVRSIVMRLSSMGSNAATVGSSSSVQVPLDEVVKEQLHRYVIANRLNVAPLVCDPMKFWLDNVTQFPVLCPVALDILAAPASQAYVERIFSVCGMLTSGRRNRLEKNLEMRVFLKLNTKFLSSLQSHP